MFTNKKNIDILGLANIDRYIKSDRKVLRFRELSILNFLSIRSCIP